MLNVVLSAKRNETPWDRISLNKRERSGGESAGGEKGRRNRKSLFRFYWRALERAGALIAESLQGVLFKVFAKIGSCSGADCL